MRKEEEDRDSVEGEHEKFICKVISPSAVSSTGKRENPQHTPPSAHAVSRARPEHADQSRDPLITSHGSSSATKNTVAPRRGPRHARGTCATTSHDPRPLLTPGSSRCWRAPAAPVCSRSGSPAPRRRPPRGSRRFWSRSWVRRRGMPHFAVYGRNFIPLFYGVSEIFLRPRKTPL